MYLTIGNLPAAIRNSNKRPGIILLRLLPIIKDSDLTSRYRLYYKYLNIIFKLIIRIADGKGLDILYVDDRIRRYFLILVVIIVDYKE